MKKACFIILSILALFIFVLTSAVLYKYSWISLIIYSILVTIGYGMSFAFWEKKFQSDMKEDKLDNMWISACFASFPITPIFIVTLQSLVDRKWYGFKFK